MNVLTDALDVLRSAGWCKNKLVDMDAHVCALGAVNTATRGRPTSRTYYREPEILALATVIKEQFPDRYQEPAVPGGPFSYYWGSIVAAFNNHEDTTFEDIERVFEKAALHLETHPTGAFT